MTSVTPAMRVVVFLRSDAESKPGGDVNLAHSFGRALESFGHQVEFVVGRGWAKYRPDKALAFNLDRPFEVAQFADRCASFGVPLYVYTLRHPVAGVSAYLRGGAAGGRRMLATVAAFSADYYETLLTLAKLALGKYRINTLSDLALISASAARSQICGHAAGLLVSGPSESAELSADRSTAGVRVHIVPHIVSQATAQNAAITPIARSIDVLCAARIEERKNQLAVLQIAQQLPDRRFVIIGSPASRSSAYQKRFLDMLSRLQNVEYRPAVDLRELRNIMGNSKVFVSLSWFEVVSLAELEAARCGCSLVVGRHSYLSDYLSNVSFVSPADVQTAAASVEKALTAIDSGAEAAAHWLPLATTATPEAVGAALVVAMSAVAGSVQ
ncbi:MAG: hypothetical protein NVS9B10_05280 [Nevskia sp.]